MKRGEIYYANLNSAVGSETDKRRPILIVSNNINNRNATVITVVPLTSNISRVYPFEVLVTPEDSGLSKPSKVQAQQIRTISKQRIESEAVGQFSDELMQQVGDAIKLHLALENNRYSI